MVRRERDDRAESTDASHLWPVPRLRRVWGGRPSGSGGQSPRSGPPAVRLRSWLWIEDRMGRGGRRWGERGEWSRQHAAARRLRLNSTGYDPFPPGKARCRVTGGVAGLAFFFRVASVAHRPQKVGVGGGGPGVAKSPPDLYLERCGGAAPSRPRHTHGGGGRGAAPPPCRDRYVTVMAAHTPAPHTAGEFGRWVGSQRTRRGAAAAAVAAAAPRADDAFLVHFFFFEDTSGRGGAGGGGSLVCGGGRESGVCWRFFFTPAGCGTPHHQVDTMRGWEDRAPLLGWRRGVGPGLAGGRRG